MISFASSRMHPIRLVVEGVPRTKKNSQVVAGSRPLPSPQFREWEALAVPQLQCGYLPACGHEEVPCLRCKATGRVGRNPAKQRKCPRCRGTKRQPAPLPVALNLAAVFYRDRNVGDLVNFVEAACDALETAGVVINDKQIAGLDGCRLDKDATRPRVEMVLTEIA